MWGSEVRGFIGSIALFLIKNICQILKEEEFIGSDFSSSNFKLCNVPLTSKIRVVNMNCHASGSLLTENRNNEWQRTWLSESMWIFMLLKINFRALFLSSEPRIFMSTGTTFYSWTLMEIPTHFLQLFLGGVDDCVEKRWIIYTHF